MVRYNILIWILWLLVSDIELPDVNDPNYEIYQKHYMSVIDYDPMVFKESGKGIVVALIDSGIVYHEDFTFTYDESDVLGHGTFIASILGARTNNDLGMAGLTPKVTLISLPCFDEALETDVETVVACINEAIDKEVDIIHMSFTTSDDPILKEAVNKALDEGIILVASSGNDLSGEQKYPASYEGVVSVNAISVQPIGLVVGPSNLSNPNDDVVVSAPGDDILGFDLNDGYKLRSGTSYATAFVSGAAVIAKAYDSEITSFEFIELLKTSSKDYGQEGYDNTYGYGVLQIANMIKQMIQ